MKIRSEENLLVLDFEREASGLWLVLVVDDRWDSVARMVCGAPEIGELSPLPGIGANCIDAAAVRDYLEPRAGGFAKIEVGIGALLFLPVAAWRQPSIGRIAFTPLPLGLTPDAIREIAGPGSTVAGLLDVVAPDENGDPIQGLFEEAWERLDQTGVAPALARARFSRGGTLRTHKDREKAELLLRLEKELEERDGGELFVSQFTKWWSGVIGDRSVGAAYFNTLTRERYPHAHDGATLDPARNDEIVAVLEAMLHHDGWGVWRWCQEKRAPSELSILRRRWHAAKAFQTNPGADKTMPVLGLVALINGLASVCGHYSVTDGLGGLDEFETYGGALGFVHVGGEKRDSQTFSAAMRAWLCQPEQFVGSHVRVSDAILQVGNGAASLRVSYTGDVPVDLRNGTGGAASTALCFVREHAHQSEWLDARTIELRFPHGPEAKIPNL